MDYVGAAGLIVLLAPLLLGLGMLVALEGGFPMG